MSNELFFVIRYAGFLDRIQQVEVAEMTIGRQATNVVCLPDSAVSRKHAVLSRKQAEFRIRDLDSAEAEVVGMIDSTRNQPRPVRPRHDREQREQQLTPAQDRVYQEFLCGHTEKEVAHVLKISINTVHTHSRAIYRKFEVSSRGELLSLYAGHLALPDN